MLKLNFVDLGDLLFAIAMLFGILIIGFEWAERRRESRRQRTLLDEIEAEYQAYYRMGRL